MTILGRLFIFMDGMLIYDALVNLCSYLLAKSRYFIWRDMGDFKLVEINDESNTRRSEGGGASGGGGEQKHYIKRNCPC